ncbi:AI-2E family transporter [Candidatus Pacearchaeota archaeon]|nr:AI-2E family transporter [Candidatus Pacearchaeota archaeon]
MEILEKDLKKIAVILLIVMLGVLVFLILKPVILSILAGLVFAYIFMPIHNWILVRVKSKTLSATLVSVLVLAIILVPLWFAIPAMIDQVFQVFQSTQNVNVQGFLAQIIPGDSEAIRTQIAVSISSALNKLTSSVLTRLGNLILEFPKIALQVVIIAFVFFFTLRDKEELKEFAAGLSPLNKNQEKELIKQFKDITESIVYGYVVVGVLQGIFAGIGFLVFGVNHVLFLTALTALFSIIPVLGPSLVYFPVFFFLIATTSPISAIVFLIYNLIVVSSLDNVLKAQIVSRRTSISQVIVLIGMIGGLFVFGVVGLLLGPLILAYFLTILRAHKEKNLSSLFNSS